LPVLSENPIALLGRHFRKPGRSDYLPPNATTLGRVGALGLSYFALRRILELVVVMMRSESANQVELIALRHVCNSTPTSTSVQ
jgi:hypothetical protein